MPGVVMFRPHKLSEGSTGSPPTRRDVYRCWGTTDGEYVQALSFGMTPAFVSSPYGFLYRQDIVVDPDTGSDQWLVTVPYAARKREVGAVTFNFDTTGGSFHIKASLETVASFPDDAIDFKQLIGVHGDDVDGTDIIIPSLKLTYGFKHPLGVVTEAFAKAVSRITGRTNSTNFRSFAPEELLFLGGTGSDGTEVEAECTYQFAASEEVTDLTVGDIMGIAKAGHDVSWVAWEDLVDGDGRPAKKPKAVYVEKVYQSADIAAILGFG